MKCIHVIGNLGANAVLRTTADGRQLMTFNVAVNQPNANPLWFNCIANMREKLFPFLVKGQTIAVVGDLSVGTYNGRVDLTVNIDKCELCGKAPESSQPSQLPAQAPTQQPNTAPAQQQEFFDAANQPTL